MSTVTKFERSPRIYDLEDMLVQTIRYGKIRLSRQDNGWYCCIAMNTNTTGTSFEVKSDFDHATPTEAADCCIQRMHAALRTLGGSMSKRPRRDEQRRARERKRWPEPNQDQVEESKCKTS